MRYHRGMHARPSRFALAVVIAATVGVGGIAGDARAADPAPPQFESTFEKSSLIDRPHTIAELELGFIALPTAPISVANRGGDVFGGVGSLGGVGKGDATLQTGIHLLYRAGRDWAIGAGATFAPKPTSDTNYVSQTDLRRTHTRSYLLVGAEARYFPIRYRWVEGWVGLVAGGVVIADRFATQGPDVPTILGAREYTVRTEGFAIGVQAGGDYMITDNWVIGIHLRADRWLLPNSAADTKRDPACSSIGDCPTLTGSVEAFEFGLTVGYRIPL
jgi:hypothetical protein